jgi:hypothetical protein
MRPQSLILLTLLVVISGWVLWMRWLSMPPVAASEPLAVAQTSPPSTPTATPTVTPTPTPLPPMPTPSVTVEVEENWLTYTSPYLGFSFRYPPGWNVEGPEANLAQREDITETIKIGAAIGNPTWINPPADSESGSIYMILDRYRRLPETPLAEWVLLNSSYSDIFGLVDMSDLSLHRMPAEYLPEGIDEGIYAFHEIPLKSVKRFWLQRGDLVYSFHSIYNLPEDVAMSLAVIKTMEFDPAIEETLRATNRFAGDDDTLRQEIEQIKAEQAANPHCGANCEYAKFMTEVERWKTLPAPERPLVQPIRFNEPDDSWQTYTQPLMGITFRYPPKLEVIDPFKEKGLDENSLFDEAIAVGSEKIMTIELFPYTRSDDVPINNWEAIQDQLSRARNPFNQFQYRIIVPIEWNHVGHHVDDMVHTQDQAPYYRIENFWLSKDGVVFKVTSSYPPSAGDVLSIISTIEFDQERLAELRASGIFAGDERTMVAELVEEWAKPRPTVDPQATPTPIPTLTPTPTLSPTPIVRYTVTPSAFDSPLVNGLRRYEGASNYTGYPNFEVWFDPTIWQWSANENGSNFLVHQTIPGCELIPDGWATHVTPLAPVTLSGIWWSISHFPTTAGDFLAYTRGWDRASYTVLVTLPEFPKVYDPDNKSQCELDAEQVIATHKVLAPDPLLPTTTPTPAQ